MSNKNNKLEIIRSILNDKYLEPNGYLKEENEDAKGRKFIMERKVVAGKNISYLSYDFVSNKNPFPFFSEVSNLKKMCDYVIFIEERKWLHVFLIELKLGTESAKKQLEAGECFAKFLIETIKRLKLDFDVTEDNLSIKKIEIKDKKSRKETLSKYIEPNEFDIYEHKHPDIFRLEIYMYA